jgi:hydroxymethylpyrimidine pyrophosphatase-like HAD family hydrolase
MRYHALACDYDGTIAHHGRVDADTLAALQRVRASGRKLLLVTGRELEDLQTVFPSFDLFDRIVAENGALVYTPATKEVKQLSDPPPGEFVARLRARGVGPISVGHAIVATWEPHEAAVLDTIREMGLELQVIFNKGAVMVLPAGVNKATGLIAALKQLGLARHNVVGVGDAENDHAFLAVCECSAAVANALPTLKERVDLVTAKDHGPGVAELIDRLVEKDLADLAGRLTRHWLLLGADDGGKEVCLPPYGESALVAGPSASGKSTATTALLERMAEKGYQFCIVDPEGDYGEFTPAVHLGNNDRSPLVEEVLDVLARPTQNVIVNLLGVPLDDRPAFCQSLLPRLQELRARTGRPHWLVIDEAHHLLPANWEPGSLALAQELDPVLLITVHPEQVAPAALRTVGTVVAVGQGAEQTLAGFCKGVGERPPRVPPLELEKGQVILWRRGRGEPFAVRVKPGKAERRRHSRKYAEGELPPERSFYFRGPAGKLNLRAQNLFLFLQIGEGVDDETWLFHLRNGDMAKWLREMVKDEELAAECAKLAGDESLGASESRRLLREAIERRYTLPAADASRHYPEKK